MSRWLPRIDALSVGGGPTPPGGTDHFAPTVIVGNELAGDPAVAQVAPFRYIPDPGNGTGIATALAELTALGTGGWIHVRRGVYTLSAAVVPLVITDNIKLTGDGEATFFVQRPEDRRVFSLTGDSPQLRDVFIRYVPASAPGGATGDAMVDASASTNAKVIDLVVANDGEAAPASADESLSAIVLDGAGCRVERASLRNIDYRIQGAPIYGIHLASPNGSAVNCDVQGATVQIFAGNLLVPTDNLIRGNRCDGVGESLQGILVGDSTIRCVVADNTIVGSNVGIEYGGVRGVIHGNTLATVSGFVILLTAASQNSVCVSNVAQQILGGGLVVDAGVANEVAHNVMI